MGGNEEEFMSSLRATHPTIPSPVKPVLRFARHFFEMCIAMCAGFAIGDAIYFLIAGALGYDKPFSDLPVLSLLVVTFNMTLPMVLWMRYRGMESQPIIEMSLSLIVPAAVILLLGVAGAIDMGKMALGEHAVMMPAMLVAMLPRLDLYTGRSMRRSAAAQ
jgi:hypothetical protein